MIAMNVILPAHAVVFCSMLGQLLPSAVPSPAIPRMRCLTLQQIAQIPTIPSVRAVAAGL